MLAPLSNYWGGGALLPPLPPSSYAYDTVMQISLTKIVDKSKRNTGNKHEKAGSQSHDTTCIPKFDFLP